MSELICPACQSALVFKLQADDAEGLYRCQGCQALLQHPKRRDKKAVATLGLLLVAVFFVSSFFSTRLFLWQAILCPLGGLLLMAYEYYRLLSTRHDLRVLHTPEHTIQSIDQNP